jgi:hypothetical protein
LQVRATKHANTNKRFPRKVMNASALTADACHIRLSLHTHPWRTRAHALRRLALNVDVELKSPHRCPVSWLDIDDAAGGRYLLTAAADGAIALFDLDARGGKHCKPNTYAP